MRLCVRSKLVSNNFKEMIFGVNIDAFCSVIRYFEFARYLGSVLC